MKNGLFAMLLMTMFMYFGGGIISVIFAGHGVAGSYTYPIYASIIVLTGIVVGTTQRIIDEIKQLKKLLQDHKSEKII